MSPSDCQDSSQPSSQGAYYLQVIETGECAKHHVPWFETDVPEGDMVVMQDGKEIYRYPSGRYLRVCPECVKGTYNEYLLQHPRVK